MRPILCPVLVGRDEELAQLEELLALTAAGTGGTVVLRGPAGIGKSRLARELQARGRHRGMESSVGRAVDGSSAPSLRPIAEALSSRLRQSGVPAAPRVRPYLPALAPLLPELAGPTTGLAGEQLRRLLPEAVLRLLEALAAPSGSLVLLEDLHWADQETLAIFEYLADNLPSVPVLCVVTLRSDQPSLALEQTERLRVRRATTVIDLKPISAGSTQAMLEAALATEQLPTGLAAAVYERSEGLPLLVEEIAADLAASGQLTAAASGWRFTPAATTPVPPSFRQLVLKRLGLLPAPTRGVIRAGAMLGREFDWRLVSSIVGLTDDEVLSSLTGAVAAQLLSVQGDRSTFRFRHALMRTAILEELLPNEHSRLAGLTADAVEAAHPTLDGDWCELAAGLREETGTPDRAARLWLQSGRLSIGRGALAAAEAALDRAYGLAADEPLRTEIQESLLDAVALAGKTDRAISLGRDLLNRLARGGAERDRTAAVHLVQARALLDAGSLPEAEGEIASVLELTEDYPLVAQAHAVASNIAAERRDASAALRLANEALEEAKALDLPDVACHSLAVIGRIERSFDVDRSIAALQRAAALAEARGLPFWRLQALQELAVSRHYREGSIDHGIEARELALKMGALLTLAAIDLQSAVALDMEDPRSALPLIDRCIETSRRHQLRLLPFAMAVKAFIHAQLLQTDAVGRAIAAAVAAAPDDIDVLALVEGVRGHVCLLAEDRDGALSHLERAMVHVRGSGLSNAYPFRGQWALLRTLEAAGGAAERAELAASPAALGSGRNRGCLALAEAVAAGRQGHQAEAEDRSRQAEALLASEPWLLNHSRHLVAEAAWKDGWGAPEPWLREAMAYFQRSGHDQIARACREMLRRRGVRLPRAGRGDSEVPPGLAALGVTRREVDILKLLADGFSNRQIAARLFLSENTVETHVTNLLAKTGTGSRAQLVAQHRPA